ncbi:MAG: class I SAM-dependent methyltransferase [Planctomycetaceae bacterium]|nr:class I SAM-dependent methyltransferase [Planctomycetaceae bacterium]
MNEELSALLRCPETGRPLRISDDGTLLLREDGSTACSIIGGIPRLTQSEHLASFGRQWTRYEVAHDDEDRATFQAKTGVRLAALPGLRILDAGCGGGRYSKVAAEAGATVVGVDHTEAVDKAAALCRHLPGAQFVQADLKRLPFEPQSFDFVFSIGVMHHDADTRRVFDAVAKLVKPGGRLSVWLYRRNQWWQEWLNNRLRRRSTALPQDQLERWCRWGAFLGGVPLVNRSLNKVISFSSHPNYENRLCDTFDWYAPQYQHHHTVEELRRWFDDAGFTEISVLPPEKQGFAYRWVYERNLLIGSGVNVTGVRTNL